MTTQQLALIDDEYLPELSQWYTPRWLAERVAAWALEGAGAGPLRVLEPSAGLGALIRPLPHRCRVDAYEIDPRRAHNLWEIPQIDAVHCCDYSQAWTDERWDLALINPPYEDGQAISHTRKAVLADADRVVAILRLSALHGVEAWASLWSCVEVRRLAICARRVRFHGVQDLSPAGGTVVVDMVKAVHPRALGAPIAASVEWW